MDKHIEGCVEIIEIVIAHNWLAKRPQRKTSSSFPTLNFTFPSPFASGLGMFSLSKFSSSKFHSLKLCFTSSRTHPYNQRCVWWLLAGVENHNLSDFHVIQGSLFLDWDPYHHDPLINLGCVDQLRYPSDLFDETDWSNSYKAHCYRFGSTIHSLQPFWSLPFALPRVQQNPLLTTGFFLFVFLSLSPSLSLHHATLWLVGKHMIQRSSGSVCPWYQNDVDPTY